MSEIAALRSQRRWMDSFFIAEGFYRAVFIAQFLSGADLLSAKVVELETVPN